MKKILIADDEKNIITVLKEAFERKGYEVIGASTGEEAIGHLKKDAKEIGTIVLDIVMPGINGVEILKQVKKKYPCIKTIILTGYLEENRDRIEKIGCDVLLSKPFSIKTLIKAVETALSEERDEEKKGLSFSKIIADTNVLAKAKLLFIEPNEIMYTVKQRYFSDRSGCCGEYEMDVAMDGEDALKKIKRFKPDILISDVNMYQLYGLGEKIERCGNAPKDTILYGVTAPENLEKVKKTTKGASFIDGVFDPATAIMFPREMDKLGKIVRSTAIAHNLYIR